VHRSKLRGVNHGNTKTTATTEVPEVAQKIREQMLSTVKQSQQLLLDAAETWTKALSALPVADLPTIPGVAALPGAEAVTKFTFDFANDLLKAQREFALQLASVLVTDKVA
jgi:hypothetical protein